MLVLLACFFISKGDLISQYFFYDMRDTGMDFFHSIEYVRGRTPYGVFNTLYPPLANLFFYFIYWLVPREVSVNWTYDFYQSINFRGSYMDLRTYQAPLLLFVLFVLLVALFLIKMVRKYLADYSGRMAELAAFCLLFSYGMMHGLERGNILILTVPLIMFFVYYYNSENAALSELAVLSLAIAAGLKIYPAFFGALLIRDKKYSQAARAVIYGVLSVILPVLFFREGLGGLKIWLNVMFDFGSANPSPHTGTGFASFLHRLAFYANQFFGLKLATGWFAAAGFLVALALLAAVLFLKKKWQCILVITVAIIMFQSQGQYIYSLLCIPLCAFLSEEKTFTKQNGAPFALMVLMLVHLPIFTIATRQPRLALLQVISVLTALWCVVTSIRNIINDKRGEAEHVNLAK